MGFDIKVKPAILDYISVTGYLNDLLAFRKVESPGFTFES